MRLLKIAEEKFMISPYSSGWIRPDGEIIDSRSYDMGGRSEHIDLLELENYKPSKDAKSAILGDSPEEGSDSYESIEMYGNKTAEIEMALYDGWIRYAGGKASNWSGGDETSVSFQCEEAALGTLSEIIQNSLSPKVLRIYVEGPGHFFDGTPENFLRKNL